MIASFDVEVHTPPQATVPTGHAEHAPAAQMESSGHTVPHAPQFWVSICVATHVLPQRVEPSGHGVQMPLAQSTFWVFCRGVLPTQLAVTASARDTAPIDRPSARTKAQRRER